MKPWREPQSLQRQPVQQPELERNVSTTQSAIKVGDRVVCIDDTGSFRRLLKGGQYVVEAAYDGTPTVIAGGAYHCLERFQKVA